MCCDRGLLTLWLVIASGALPRVIQALPSLQPNPPAWPASVQVFGPEDNPGHIVAVIRGDFAVNGGHTPKDHGQFSDRRFAFLFRPGTYRVDVPVGYYTQVLGLGLAPGDVLFDGPRGVYSEEGDQSDMGGALSTFWRGAENFRNRADLLWAVSQAAPLRRVIADGKLNLAQFVAGVGMGFSSGGFVANVVVAGTMNSGSQQQFCARNSQFSGGWQGGVWNMVFVGTAGAPPGHCGHQGGSATVNVATTPVIAEKPFISISPSGQYSLNIPPVRRGRVGIDWAPGRVVDFSRVYVAKEADSAAIINAHLQQGFDVVLSPGIYHLEGPIEIIHDNQVLLGLGLATLVAEKGTAALRVGNVDGVRVAGVLLQAGAGATDALMEWGDGSHPGDPRNPGFLHDVFARVGGPNDPGVVQVRAKVMLRVASGNVVGDNMWLWRADHGVAGLVKGSANPCETGLVVTGNNVTMYGLAVEHTLQDQVQWAGQGGETYFFQSELPYDVTPAFGHAGYVGYRVHESVASHRAHGLGVYHFFRDYAVTVQRGISVPPWLANFVESPLSVYLTGHGQVQHVINDRGSPTGPGLAHAQWSCERGPYIAPPPAPARLPAQPFGDHTPPGFGPSSGASPLQPQARGELAKSAGPGIDPYTGGGEHGQHGIFVPWWVFAIAFQSILLMGIGIYVMTQRHHRQVMALKEALGLNVCTPTSVTRRAAQGMGLIHRDRSPVQEPSPVFKPHSPPRFPLFVALARVLSCGAVRAGVGLSQRAMGQRPTVGGATPGSTGRILRAEPDSARALSRGSASPPAWSPEGIPGLAAPPPPKRWTAGIV